MAKIVVIGASSGPGRLLFEHLRDEGKEVLGIARHPRGLTSTTNASFVEIDASDPLRLLPLVDKGDTVLHCSKPEILTRFLGRQPRCRRLIALGSTRIYSAYPDSKCHRLKQLQRAIRESGLDATLLHPTMIYGAPGLNNIERIVKIAAVSPVIPLPRSGGSLIQPIHAEDVVAAICACLERPETNGMTISLPGPAAISYREFVETCIAASGKRCRVVSLTYPLLVTGALLTRILPGIPAITRAEVRRLLEDKAFDVTEMIEQLGVTPRSFKEGISQILL